MPRSFGSRQPSATESLASLKRLLSIARSLDGLSVDQLVRMYNVDRKVVEYELTIARQRREAHAVPEGRP